MGMYTEFIFEGELINDIPEELIPYIEYFFTDKYEYIPFTPKINHEFFESRSFERIGYSSSYYFIPFAVRKKRDNYVFLRCDLKNYDNEIQKFLNWIYPYMKEYRGYYWYEEDENPIVFRKEYE